MSITLALKIIFNLNANSAYGTPYQSAVCEELLQECEMSLVRFLRRLFSSRDDATNTC
jgi:hypothetical protein